MGMTEAAAEALHSIGTVLNGVTVSAGRISDNLNQSWIPASSKALALLYDYCHSAGPDCGAAFILELPLNAPEAPPT